MRHALPDPLLAQLSEFLAARIGLHFPRERWGDLDRAVGNAAKELGHQDTAAYVMQLLSRPLQRSQAEVLASHLTIGETYFFRDRKSFDSLEQAVLPELIRSRRASERRLRIWSAGCCTGEEPYSIAMLLARMIPDLAEWNVSILATDINPHFLQKAARGIYTDWSFRDAPPGIKELFFKRTKEGRFEIVSRIRTMVTFAYLNLAQDPYPSVENGTNAMDIVFCRNVLMYFEASQSRRVLQNLGLALMPDGCLFVSPIEISQLEIPELFTVNLPGVIVYRKGVKPTTPEHGLTDSLLDPVRAESVEALQPENHTPFIPERKPLEIVATTQTLYQQGHALYEQGRYAEAAEKIGEGLAQDSNDAKAMALLARVHANQGNLTEASTWCRKAVAADKLNPGWCYLLATILQEQGQADEAASALKRALYLDQNYALAHFALGNLTRRLGKPKDASRHFRNALSTLSDYRQEDVLPESEGMTAGRLAEIIRSTVSSQAAI